MVLAEKLEAPKQTAGGIQIPATAKIEGYEYDCAEAMRGGGVMRMRVVDVGPAGQTLRGHPFPAPSIRVGDEILCKVHVGEKVKGGEPEIWSVDWDDILAVVEPDAAAA